MRLHIADDTGEEFYCPECERELWPAYWTEEGLAVCGWTDFDPADGQAGLLVCGNPDCTHEEAITFADSPTDAVVWNYEWTWIIFRGDAVEHNLPPITLQRQIEQLEQAFVETGRAKLPAALTFFRQELAERQERVDRWLAAAQQSGHPVNFWTEEGKLQGRILGSHGAEFVLETPDGQVHVLPKHVVGDEHIEYPPKPRRRPPELEGKLFLSTLGQDYIVVNGYHLGYGNATELGGYHVGRCWDPEVAAALHLREESPGYWEGVFRAEEIERYYLPQEMVKIRGHWLEDAGRNQEVDMIYVRTADPAIAQALDLGPVYRSESAEFGNYDGDVYEYEGFFACAEIEATRWDEDVHELPPADA